MRAYTENDDRKDNTVTSIELRRQDTADLGRMFEEYSERLLGYCQRRLGSRSEAEDAMQTTFLYAHRALRRGVEPGSESAWLYTIAKNVCRWQQRTNSRRGPAASNLDVDALASPEDEVDESGLRHELGEALAAIPERQRQAIVLREWRGLSCTEIASQLALSGPATHALLTRARRSVASALSAGGRRPVLGLDFGSLLLQLRHLFAGASAKVAVGAVVVTGLGVGGVTVDRALEGDRPAANPAPPTALTTALPAPSAPAASARSRTVFAQPRPRKHRAPERPRVVVDRPTGASGEATVASSGDPKLGAVSPVSPTEEAGEIRPSAALHDVVESTPKAAPDVTVDLPRLPDLESATDDLAPEVDLPPPPEAPDLPAVEVEAPSLQPLVTEALPPVLPSLP
jgi:RNA polymerase sigma-70 factor (ECF subfamily)